VPSKLLRAMIPRTEIPAREPRDKPHRTMAVLMISLLPMLAITISIKDSWSPPLLFFSLFVLV
jgi:hypothetical protein